MPPLKLTPLPFARDNYLWLLDNGKQAVLVDPGEAAPALAALDARGLEPVAILLTHHHDDHIGGVAGIVARHPGLAVYGPRKEDIATVTHPVDGDDRIALPALGLDFLVLDVAAHTRGHVAYLGVAPYGERILFCGDALFSAGCGRLFEGSSVDLERALARLARLPPATRVCCAHEYTLSNLAFAHAAEPDNAMRDAYEARCRVLRAEGRPTLPGTIATELAVNPFLRCAEKGVQDAVAKHRGVHPGDAQACLAALREWKDGF